MLEPSSQKLSNEEAKCQMSSQQGIWGTGEGPEEQNTTYGNKTVKAEK